MARLHLSPPDAGAEERRLLLDAFDSGWIAPIGPHVDAFEAEFAAVVGVPHAAALSSGTAGLHLALMLLGVQRGDSVLVPSLTFVATASAVTYVGAVPVFVDSSPADWNLDPDLLAEELDARARSGRLPKAVISVDLYGQCACYDSIVETCAGYDIPIIEDAAEALGARYRSLPAGGFGAIGVFSFNGNKIITTGGGGMLVSAHREWVQRARFLATQARDPAPHYQHSEIGYNYRLSNLLAAVGRGQLRSLDLRITRRRAINRFYREVLGDVEGIGFMPISHKGAPNYWLTCITVDARAFGASPEDIRAHLETLDIESRPVWKPLHLQPVFAECEMRGGAVAEAIFERGLCLPTGTAMTEGDLGRVAEGIRATPRTRSGWD